MAYQEIRTNLGTIIATWQGGHSPSKAYKTLNIVSDNKGSTYLCILDTIEGTPLTNTQHWAFMSKGAYQYWIDLGNTGSTQDFIEWLQSPAVEIAEEVEAFLDDYATTTTAAIDAKLAEVNAKLLDMDEMLATLQFYENLVADATVNAGNQAVYAKAQGDYALAKGSEAHQKGNTAQIQGAYALEQGNYAKAKGEDALAATILTNEATQIATEVSADMQEIIDNPPILQEVSGRQIWHYWDIENDVYVSTGIPGSVTEKGPHNPTTPYKVLDIVENSGTSYLCILDTTSGVLITNTTYWRVLAQVGRTPEFEIGTITTLAEGESATVEITLSDYDAEGNPIYTMDLGIPRGYSGVYVGEDEPTDPTVIVWIDPDEGENFITSSEFGTSDSVGATQELVTKSMSYLNLDKLFPLSTGFYTSTTARVAVPAAARGLGMVITYQTSSGVWYTERFIGTDISTWATESNWEVVVSKTILESTEEVTAVSLVDLRKEVDVLKTLINDAVRTYAQIETLSVKTLQLNGAPLFVFGTAAPAVVPDFVGQIYIKTTATTAVWIATGDSATGNWKEV